MPDIRQGRRESASPKGHPQVLIVDDEPANRFLCRKVFGMGGIECGEAVDGEDALIALQSNGYELIVLDVDMPRMNGPELLHRLRLAPPAPHLKVMMLSGKATGDEMARLMASGADDYLTKPFSPVQLLERAKSLLRLKRAQDEADTLRNRMFEANRVLETHLSDRDSDLVGIRNALIAGLTELTSSRDSETGAHIRRLSAYAKVLATTASESAAFASRVTPAFVNLLCACAPLHDIGKVGVPDRILLKPGPLDPEERAQMQRHTVIGADALMNLMKRHGAVVGFLQMAADIARHHHERWDGHGYPDRLSGEAIPLAARIVSVADVYDALRSERPYKKGLDHNTTTRIMLAESPGQFDPGLLQAFRQCGDEFARLYHETPDEG